MLISGDIPPLVTLHMHLTVNIHMQAFVSPRGHTKGTKPSEAAFIIPTLLSKRMRSKHLPASVSQFHRERAGTGIVSLSMEQQVIPSPHSRISTGPLSASRNSDTMLTLNPKPETLNLKP